jgi:hypothetical protein
MTKKHYIQLAKAIKLRLEDTTPDQYAAIKVVIEQDLCPILWRAHTDFDKARFLTACGF